MKEALKSAVNNYIHSYNSFDVAGMLKNLDESIIFENISNGKIDLTTNGKDEFTKQAETAKSYFSKRKQTITHWEINGEVVTIDITYDAILAIDLPNGLKPGDSLQLKGQSIFQFKNRKIVKIQDKS